VACPFSGAHRAWRTFDHTDEQRLRLSAFAEQQIAILLAAEHPYLAAWSSHRFVTGEGRASDAASSPNSKSLQRE
jgi:hypothetical protein